MWSSVRLNEKTTGDKFFVGKKDRDPLIAVSVKAVQHWLIFCRHICRNTSKYLGHTLPRGLCGGHPFKVSCWRGGLAPTQTLDVESH